jgi:GcrA cell cycle regulator
MASREAPQPAWSPGRVDLLRLHFDLGLSAKRSAELIGDGVTRNAVISKRRRLGLMGANPLQTGVGPTSRVGRTTPLPRRSSRAKAGLADEPTRREPLPFMDWPDPAGATPKTLTHREPGECAWPLGPAEAPGDDRTLFCCAPVEVGRSYCAVHDARVIRATEPNGGRRIRRSEPHQDIGQRVGR